ncbi:hypothetical protein O6H91_20G008900 [Diphasiastrum complanatum]|uniref:Uncharacterized protein n=1 Tax=Diphasiastrum complanatum TaxID=34168 RepID=A0ACC2AMR6_DIPCM|nr:hypothetical protein O6H91_20G008900 [Diphasiastrum complanatum]
MDSRRNTSAPTFDDDQDSTRACTTSFDGTAFGYKHGMMLAVGVQEDLFVDEFSVNNLSSLGRQINDDGDGCEEERCSSTTQADRRKQIKEDDPFNDSLAREISFKWSVLEDTRNSGIQGTCISEINPCDPSSARIADSPASSVSSCSANVRLATLTKLFPSNGKVVSTAPEQKRANCCKLQSKHSENDGEVISTAGEQERANCKLQSEHSDSDCHSCEEYISSLRTKDNENWEKSFVKPVEEEDHFEDVLFDDIAEGEKQESAGAWDSVYSFEPFQHSFSVSPKSSSAPRLSSSSFDAESSFASPLDSPLHQRPGLHLAKGSSSLVHLIDSAIQGSDSKSLQRLRRIVAGHETVSLENDENNHGEDVTWWVVDNVLAKMGFVEGCDGGEESSASPIMLGAGAAILGGNLIPWLPTVPDKKLGISARTRMMKSLALILNACTRNRALCSAAGLLLVLLRTLFIIHDRSVDRTDQMVECDDGPLLDAIEALGAHSLSVSDLQEWLNIAGDLIPEKISLDLMFALERAMLREETKGPSYSFEFDGVNSGLLAPGEAKWPFANGYAFATWLYIESFAEGVMQATVAETNTKSLALSAAPCINDLRGEETARMPRLFSFLSTDKEGIEAYFQNGLLIIETTSGKGKQSSVCFNHPFNPRHWYFVGVEHTYRQVLWGKTESEVRLYIDGRLYETELLELPRISKALELCCIGAKPGVALARSQSRHRQCPSCAEFGPFYIFKEPIGSAKMAQLAARGADALPSFGNGAGISRLSVRKSFAEESVTLDTEIGFQLHLLYHPKLLVRRSCMDASPLGASGKHRRHAEVLGHVLVVHRTRPVDSIWAMAEGGPMALLPLMIGFLDKNSLQPIFPDSTISAGAALLSIPIFRVVALALRYGRIAEEMHAPQVLAYLLRHLLCVPWEREKELVSSVIYLSLAFNKDTVLKVQFFKYVLLNLKVWCCCPPEVQKMYLSSLSDIIVTDESTMRDANAVQMLLDGCRSCYWLTPEVDSVCKLDNGRSCRPVLQPNPLVDELLIVVELLINSAQRSTVTANIRCLVQFVLDCPQRHQDIFILASTSSENRFKLTTMTEWPDWILEILISNYEAKARKLCDNHTSFHDIEDLIYSILTIVLHYSMRIEDGWKDVEAVIQCAEWSAILGGSSIGEQRMRREESLPKFKRRLLGNLLDFSVRELQKQAENAAAVAAAVAAENSNANAAKAEAEAATQKSLSLCRNSLVLLMFVEDHLRLQCNDYSLAKGPQIVIAPELDVAEAMDEPYESVRCAFASYGSYGIDLAEGWKFRSQLWHGVGLLTGTAFGGGGRDLETVNSMAEKEGNGEWIEYSLVNKSVEMLQALLMNSSDFGGEAGVGGGAGSLQALQQLLDNDQTFYAMLRMVLLALREEDRGGNHKSSKSKYASTFSEMHFEMRSLEDSERVPSPADIADDKTRMTTSRMKSDLLQCVLAPLLTRVVSESRRQRVLVALCILYSELWHSVSSEGKLLREHYLNTIVPLLIRLLRKWRPLLTGIYELTCANGLSPLTIEDLSILTDVPSTEAALTLISPFWAAAFASPPAAMALAIAAAGVGEGEMPVPKVLYAEQGIRHVERNTLRLLSFSNLLRSTEAPSKATSMHNRKERGSASQEVDKEHKVDYVKAFRVANMESSVQRRTASDRERARRWNILKAMNSIWLDCFPSTADMATGSVLQASQTSSKCSINLLRMVEDTRNRHLEEIQRRARASADDDKATSIGVHAWCSFVHRLLEMEALVGPVLK